jgi:hypothetical protein
MAVSGVVVVAGGSIFLARALREAGVTRNVLAVNFDATLFIEQCTHELNFNLILAAVLTSLVCWLFLGSWSSAVNIVLAIPTSILAKRANHLVPAATVITSLLALAGLSFPLTIPALAGVVNSFRRRRELSLVAAWLFLYLAGMTAARIEPLQFVWYFSPLIPALGLAAGAGVEGARAWTLARLGGTRPRLTRSLSGGAVAYLGLTAAAGGFFIPAFRSLQFHTSHNRVQNYLAIGRWLSERARPGQVVMVAECGALSYMLMEQNIFDQSGLNSPEVYTLCRTNQDPTPEDSDLRPRFLTAECELELIKTKRPDYIVTFSMFMHIGELSQVPLFRESYRRLDLGRPELLDYIVMEKVQTRPKK